MYNVLKKVDNIAMSSFLWTKIRHVVPRRIIEYCNTHRLGLVFVYVFVAPQQTPSNHAEHRNLDVKEISEKDN